ncbi:MAG TPA: hypothetical protein VFT29_04635 [Gemmatimonadaceae bacterium]|nr:hypothetical protein [Gemmatimonadaceae bacterium]
MSESTLISLTDAPADTRPLDDLTEYVYESVQADRELAHMFASMPGDHREHLFDFLSEVFRGPDDFVQPSTHAHVLTRHVGRYFTLQQRRSWMDLVVHAAGFLGWTDDPQTRLAVVEYLEWGSRNAVPKPSPRIMVC